MVDNILAMEACRTKIEDEDELDKLLSVMGRWLALHRYSVRRKKTAKCWKLMWNSSNVRHKQGDGHLESSARVDWGHIFRD
ncbi:hypothetical protein MPTK1_2g12630 [Marchantia polymorpha subsp. ruderalis]|uniref:Uncharacterized protein n=1 Tax=Marchantia polymorpha TaxID=3197 RepID=A0A2R6XAV1_MARPO|nr:hypothetical protein MARPO_0026s0108 [Marchantia polymorpha]BBN02084.1 hypothetical protein Mp_2g12630 [Marchantia polymorpha subsp. ruderalis]|eukprot:PTQ43236.1 hypothetical protein MARPO_0026s0108 [Marchantia polymorpha]